MTVSGATQYKRYIPQLIKTELDQIEYTRKDNLYTILNMIYSQYQYYKNDTQKEYSYTHIPQKKFQLLLGKRENINIDLDFLEASGFIEIDPYYSADKGVCKGYRVAAKYLSKAVTVVITNERINKRIGAEIDRIKEESVKNLELQKTKYYKSFRIRFNDAMAYIENMVRDELRNLCINFNIPLTKNDIENLVLCQDNFRELRGLLIKLKAGNEFYNIMHRYIQYSVQVRRIDDGSIFFKRNSTNDRLDTSLSSLPGCLVKFLVHDANSELYSIDLKSSQPFFLYTLIKDDETIDQAEIAKYRDLVISGTNKEGLYEFLTHEYNSTHTTQTDREGIKKMMMKIFYSKNKDFSREKAFFMQHFPGIYKYIEACKVIEHNRFAIKLQKLEAKTVLDTVMPRLLELGIIPYTIHDSFICLTSEVETIVQVIQNYTQELFGCSPVLKVDCITRNVGEGLRTPEIIEAEIDADSILNYEEYQPEIIDIQVTETKSLKHNKTIEEICSLFTGYPESNEIRKRKRKVIRTSNPSN